MVSSKCCQVESPSPLRFLAALMPPWAHTECDRFTGTMENKSTWPPASAILMVAARPASPPPITIILGFNAIFLDYPSCRYFYFWSGLFLVLIIFHFDPAVARIRATSPV